MKARAAIMRAFNTPLSLEEVDIPPLEPGQVLVQVDVAGVCGSDVHMWRGHDPRTPLPIILGHEGLGRVVDINGPKHDLNGRSIQPGDRILWERGVTCGRCYYCAVLKQPSLCPHRWAYGIHRSFEQPPHLNGCYADHIILDAATHLISLDGILADDDDPAPLVAASCSGATAAHGFDLLPTRVGDTVVILGPGPLGAFSVLLARAAGAAEIVVIGGTGPRLDLCARLGATRVLNRRETELSHRIEAVRDLTHGRGADLVVEASGSIDAVREGLDLVRRGGGLSLVGIGAPVGEMPLSPFEDVVQRNVRVQGVWVSDVTHTLQAMALVRRYAADLEGFISHRFPLDQATAALEAVAGRDAIKAVLVPGA
ncbi:MAG: zinc-binding dehydrogenase [Anaerolineae bacterium]|jgi:threonine dehydrogenase-like Zn-dependent dehydrogenase